VRGSLTTRTVPLEARMVEESTNNKPNDLVRALLSTWHELEPYTGDADEGVRASEDQRVVSRWRTLFGPEILYVRSARNLVANSPDSMAQSELQEAVEAAQKLRDLLFSGLKDPAAVLGA
jgi:hypothetical protein